MLLVLINVLIIVVVGALFSRSSIGSFETGG
jgi:hypothetical protein